MRTASSVHSAINLSASEALCAATYSWWIRPIAARSAALAPCVAAAGGSVSDGRDEQAARPAATRQAASRRTVGNERRVGIMAAPTGARAPERRGRGAGGGGGAAGEGRDERGGRPAATRQAASRRTVGNERRVGIMAAPAGAAAPESPGR